jgi:hypothetical protein
MRALRQRTGVNSISTHQRATMSRTLRPLAVLAMVALISVISAGCGSNAPSETGTGSAGKGARMQESARTGFRFRDLSPCRQWPCDRLGPPTTMSFRLAIGH